MRVNVEPVSRIKEGKKIQNTLEMLLHNREMSYDELAKQCGMTYNGIAKIAKQQNQSIQYATVKKITTALNITANDLLGYFYSLPQPQIDITDIYQLSEQSNQVYKVGWRIKNYHLEMLFTVILSQTATGKNEVEFCIDDLRGAYSEDFLYSLLQGGKESFQQAIEASIQRMLPKQAQHKQNSYKVVFSVMKESNLFFITHCTI